MHNVLQTLNRRRRILAIRFQRYGGPRTELCCESTTLASQPLPPATFRPKLLLEYPSLTRVDSSGFAQISDPQCETLIFAMLLRFMQEDWNGRCGFLFGDQTGLDKSRPIAAIIWELLLRGCKKCLWVSVSTDLTQDAMFEINHRIYKESGGPLELYVHHAMTDAVNLNHKGNSNNKAPKKIKRGILFMAYTKLRNDKGYQAMSGMLKGMLLQGDISQCYREAFKTPCDAIQHTLRRNPIACTDHEDSDARQYGHRRLVTNYSFFGE